jgi:hypothetical protein
MAPDRLPRFGAGQPRTGLSRRAAPQARRELKAAINADALAIRRAWIRELPSEDGPRKTVVVRVGVGGRPEVAAWLEDPEPDAAAAELRAEWLFIPATPEAVLIAAVDGDEPFRFNLRFAAVGARRHLRAIARSGVLGLTTVPLRLGEDDVPESPVRFIAVPTGPLRGFLRNVRSGAVV